MATSVLYLTLNYLTEKNLNLILYIKWISSPANDLCCETILPGYNRNKYADGKFKFFFTRTNNNNNNNNINNNNNNLFPHS